MSLTRTPRISRRTTLGLLAPAALGISAIIALSGCTGPSAPSHPDDPTPKGSAASAVAIGTCLDGTVDNPNGGDDPDLTSVVDCSEPHLYEVTGFLDLSSDWIDPAGSVKEIDAQRSNVADKNSAHHADYVELSKGCSYLATIGAGLDVELNGVDAEKAALVPYAMLAFDRSIPPAEYIARTGKAQLTCAVRYTDTNLKSRPAQSQDSSAALYSYLSNGFPLENRICLENQGDKGMVIVGCDKPHFAEPFAGFDAEQVFGKEFVERGARALSSGEELSDDDYATGDQACAAAFGGTVDGGSDEVAYLFLTANDWTDPSTDTYVGSCAIAAKDWSDHNTVGSLLGIGSGKVESVPVS